MKNILVTGGTGFIGSHTVVELYNAKLRPVIIDDLSNSSKSVLTGIKKISGEKPVFYRGKFQDKELLDRIFSNEKIDGVIHFAANKAVGESVLQPLKYYRNNVAGLVALLETMASNNISNLVFSSSCTVYGNPSRVPVTETSPVQVAVSPYGATKQMDEIIIRDTAQASKTLRALALRYFNPIGAHPSSHIGELPLGEPNCLIPYITQTAIGIRKKLTIYGNDYPTQDGTCIRDYIHVVDLAKAHIKALSYLNSQPVGYYDFINFGTGKGTSVLDVIKSFEKISGRKLRYSFGPRRLGDAVSIYSAIGKAERMLGWCAEKSLDDALNDAWHWQQKLAQNAN